jgi:hypothetical protein
VAFLSSCFLTGACLYHGGIEDCPEGQLLSDGQCVPTSSIVFQRCVDTFRKSAVETNEGVDTQVGANAAGYGGSLKRTRTDHVAAEYTALPDELVPEAITECGRQEQAEREQQVQRAWEAADAARARALQAERKRGVAQRDTKRAEKKLEAAVLAQRLAEEAREQIADARDDLQAELDEQKSLLADKHPCTAGDWHRCGRQALVAKRAGDYARAHELYELSCDEGDGEACSNWGVMFEHGLGVIEDPDRAAELYALACEAGESTGCQLARRLDGEDPVAGEI